MDTVINSVAPGDDAHTADQHAGDVRAERSGGSPQGHPSWRFLTRTRCWTMKAESESLGSTCALLTPAIKTRLRELESARCSRFGSTTQLPGKILQPGVAFPEMCCWR